MTEERGLGSKNPFILRNYRYIYPAGGKTVNIDTSGDNRDNNLQFKIDGAPVILPYESDVVVRFTLSPNANFTAKQDVFNRVLNGGETTFPPYRIKFKSLASAVKYCRVNLSNYSFYSINTPIYLTENIYRKTPRFVFSRPDSYTSENCMPVSIVDVNNQRNGNLTYALAPAGTLAKAWDNTSFVTPVVDPNGNYVIDFRIPFTDLLPVFKAGVIPMLMINSQSFDMTMNIRNPRLWFVPTIFTQPAQMDIFLSLTTVALPEMNPLAELLIKPHLTDRFFRAPYLDYFVIDQVIGFQATYLGQAPVGGVQAREGFNFNVLQYFRNVPFISLSFLDMSSAGGGAYTAGTLEPAGETLGQNGLVDPYSESLQIPLSPQDREAAGFYTLPPAARIEELNVRLGPSAFPITQWAMDTNMAYLMNRKHFEMYGRRYNETRISPNSRLQQGDATIFFDLSHGPYGGFQIDADNPLQVTGFLDLSQCFYNAPINVRVMLTIWYTNHLLIDTDSGAVVTEQ